MPHKHTRRVKDESTFDLPPSQIARSLPARDNGNGSKNGRKPTPGQPEDGRKRKRSLSTKDDAPRAFKRLMAYAGGKKPRSGLDNGDEPAGKKKKKSTTDPVPSKASETNATSNIPTIQPGERISEFAARVDAALPLSGLVDKSVKANKDPLGLKPWQTKKEKKMHKMYDEWREQERKLKEKREEDLELQAEKELEDEENGVSWKLEQGRGRKKKGKRSKYLGETAEADEDPWEELKKKRGETRAGLHDVVQAPPEFTAKPSRQLTVRGAAVEVDGVPKAAGSLKRREELQSVRDDIVASYRKMMSQKRPSLHAS
ncbi:hypothetical protein GGR56DRAFT_656905 [Xylariaceae sp. FL0804]|nr:hypothetical protein GGR56DRAFT_656905 [Xylariaceae sp. FL0804]